MRLLVSALIALSLFAQPPLPVSPSTKTQLGPRVRAEKTDKHRDDDKESPPRPAVKLPAASSQTAQLETKDRRTWSELVKEGFAPNTWPNWALLVAAGVAAVIAMKTLRATARQAQIAGDAAVLTRQTLLLTHRPKLVVRGVYLESGTLQEGRLPAGHFFVVNIGGSNAKIRELWSDAQIGQPSPSLYEPQSGAKIIDHILAPGESIKLEFAASRGPVGGSDAHGWTTGNRHLYFFGFVKYVDEMDVPVLRQTAFCRRRSITTGFQPVPDEDYEHAD